MNKQLRSELSTLKQQLDDLQTRHDAKSSHCDALQQQYTDILTLISEKSSGKKKSNGKGEWNPDAIHELVSENQELRKAAEALQSDKKDLQQELKSALVLIERMRLAQSNDNLDADETGGNDNANDASVNDTNGDQEEKERSEVDASSTPVKESSLSPYRRLVNSRQRTFRSRLCGETSMSSPSLADNNENHVSFFAEISEQPHSPQHENVFTLKSFFARSPGIKR
jgi:hypothetical protein